MKWFLFISFFLMTIEPRGLGTCHPAESLILGMTFVLIWKSTDGLFHARIILPTTIWRMPENEGKIRDFVQPKLSDSQRRSAPTPCALGTFRKPQQTFG
jgi:hypothetical protein